MDFDISHRAQLRCPAVRIALPLPGPLDGACAGCLSPGGRHLGGRDLCSHVCIFRARRTQPAAQCMCVEFTAIKLAPQPVRSTSPGFGPRSWAAPAPLRGRSCPVILTTPRHWLAGSCADRAGAPPLRTPRCPGPAPAPTSASAPAVGHRPPGHSGTLRTSGPRTFRADGARGPVRSGLAAPRPTGGRGRRTSQKIPVLCGDPSPKTLGPSQVSDSAL